MLNFNLEEPVLKSFKFHLIFKPYGVSHENGLDDGSSAFSTILAQIKWKTIWNKVNIPIMHVL